MKRGRIFFLAVLSALFVLGCGPEEKPTPEPTPEPVVNPEPTPEPTPDPTPEPTPDPPTTPMSLTAKWEISSSLSSSGATKWTNENKFFAPSGDGANKAYISTSTGNTLGTEPVRGRSGNNIAVANMAPGDAIVFTYPNLTLAKGTTVDFMANFLAPNASSPKYWLFEYYDGGEWKTVEEDLHAASEDASLKYSFYVKYFSAYQYTTFFQSFTLSEALVNQDLTMRCRVVGNYNNGGGALSPSASAYTGLVNNYWSGAQITVYQGIPVKETKKLAVIGNSFTYYYGTNFILKQIARSQGHELRIRAHTKGGQDFGENYPRELTQWVIKDGGYDYALLQDMSTRHSDYYKDPTLNSAVLADTKTILNAFKSYSPSVRPIVENTWSFLGSSNYEGYGSLELFDKALQGGALLVADATDTWLSPINEAFKQARAAGITDLLHTDNKHPNRNGAYLKACVNYLLLYGEAFDANVPDCLVSAATAAKLRSIAETVVLGNINSFRNPDASKVVPGEGLSGGGGETPGPTDVTLGENGIKNTAQLLSFAALAASGGDISSYKNAAGEVALLEDIELSGTPWTPIGNISSIVYNAVPSPVSYFSGTFNGNGHTITGLTLDVSTNQVNLAGFFGATVKAVIKDVVFEDVVLKFNSSGISSGNIALGTVAACAVDTKFENVHVKATYSGKATSTAARFVSLGGIAGFVSSTQDGGSSFENCTFDGEISNDIGTKYSNANTAIIGGIAGGVANAGKLVYFKKCENKASINVKAHRVAGIVSSGFYSRIEECVNGGNISAVHSGSAASGSVAGCRIGGVMAYCSFTSTNSSYLKDCLNTGTISSTEPSSAVGGVAGLIRTYTLRGCRNTGNVIGPEGTRGLLVGSVTSADVPSTFENCSFKGSIGAKADGSDAVAATADNYLPLGISFASGVSSPTWNADNVKFIAE